MKTEIKTSPTELQITLGAKTNKVAPGQSIPAESTNDSVHYALMGLVVASNAQIVGEAIFNGGSLSGLIHTRNTHRHPKRVADYAGLRIRKGDAQAWLGKAYWIAGGQDHPLVSTEFRSLESLKAAIEKSNKS